MRRNQSRFRHVFAHSRPQLRRVFRPQLELLEDKTLLSTIVPTYQVLHTPSSHPIHPLDGPPTAPAGLGPTQIRTAYGINSTNFTSNGQTVAGDGSGQTVAIVDAYDDPSIVNDLSVFDSQFFPSSPAPTLVKVGINSLGQGSTSSFPSANSGWAGEIELDVEWAHAVAPGATILLVEAHSAGTKDLLNAINFARNYTGQFGGAPTSVVSMSWGGNEFFGQTQYDSYFTAPSGHIAETFFGSSGDNGAPSGWPATSSHVIGVGGTTLNVDSSGNYLSESGWSGSGGGISQVVLQPSYQNGLIIHNGSQVISAGGMRASPDVAYDADPNTGVAVYGTFGFGGWAQIGGTSAGAPQWAALVAIADQGRTLAGSGTLDGFTQTLPDLYNFANDFNDITSGSNGYAAGSGYDLVTGLGTPRANKLIPDLAGNNSGATPPTITTPASATLLTPTTATLAVAATDPAGAASLTYTWSELSGPASATFSPNGTNAAQTSTATFSKVGSYTFQVTVTDPAGLTATSQVSYTVTPVLTSVSVSPASASVADTLTKQFTATGADQFGSVLATQPSFTWSLDAGSLGTVSTTGLYTAPASGTGSATVRATSGAMSGTAQVTVTTLTGPTITTAAQVTSQTSTTAALAVAATDPAGASTLTYTWAESSGPAAVTFSPNSTHTAANTTVTFTAVGTYTLEVTVVDPSGLSATSSVTVTVAGVLTSFTITPASVTLAAGATQPFTANAADQFGHALTPPPAITWSVSGPGTITSAGLFTAGSGSATVLASSGGLTAKATVTVPGSSLTFTSPGVPAYVYPWTMTISYLAINQDVTIGSLKATLNIVYPYDGDLVIDLISPKGTDVTLSYFEGYGANFQNTTFDDNAALPISYGNSPFAGSYKPETPLAALMGQDARGTWALVVSDYGFSYGVLTAWSLTITPAQMIARGPTGGIHRHDSSSSRVYGHAGAQAYIATRAETYQSPGFFLASSHQGTEGRFGGPTVFAGMQQGFGGLSGFVSAWGSGVRPSAAGARWDFWDFGLGL